MYISLDSLKDIVCIQLDSSFVYACVAKTVTFSITLYLLDYSDIEIELNRISI